MKQEEKELLLLDLSSRLPYHPKCKVKYVVGTEYEEDDIAQKIDIISGKIWVEGLSGCGWEPVENIKPYLRPLYDITETEKAELEEAQQKDNKTTGYPHFALDYLVSRDFDVRGLIDKGLAIETEIKEVGS